MRVASFPVVGGALHRMCNCRDGAFQNMNPGTPEFEIYVATLMKAARVIVLNELDEGSLHALGAAPGFITDALCFLQ